MAGLRTLIFPLRPSAGIRAPAPAQHTETTPLFVAPSVLRVCLELDGCFSGGAVDTFLHILT